MWNDLQYAFRQLFKSPAFSAVAILTIALGIGANTAIFSVVNGVLLNPLPYPDPGRIVVLFERIPMFEKASISYPNFLDWQRMNHSLSELAAYRVTSFNLSREGEPEHLRGEMVSPEFFQVFGVEPIIGRTFNVSDDHRGAAPTAMISEGLWRRKFGAARDVIGRRLTIDGVGRTVIGVVPASLRLTIQNFNEQGAGVPEIYTPVGEFNEPSFYADRGAGWGLDAVGRLKPGVTLDVARQDMDRVSRELAAAYPKLDSNERANLVSLREETVGDVRLPLLVLLGAVFFVLLISCVNVANLLLARSTARQHEFAVRLAIGAGQFRIIRQLLTESVVLALAGAGLGLLFAQFGTAFALGALPYTLPRAEEVGLDWRVLSFTMLCAVAAGIIFGLAPALKLRRPDLGGALRETGRSVAGARSRIQHIFVIAEMALALVLLVGAGLMIRTLFVLWGTDPGFRARPVTTLTVSPQSGLAEKSPDTVRAFFRRMHDQLASMPGIEAASLNWGATPMRGDTDFYIWFVGRPKPSHTTDMPMALTYIVEPDFLRTLQIPLKRGRFLTASDDENGENVVVIDDVLAQTYFHGKDPIGQYLDLGNDSQLFSKRPTARIVGIVGHINQWGLDLDAKNPLRAEMYLSGPQMSDALFRQMAHQLTVYVRGKNGIAPDPNRIRERLQALNSGLVAYEGQPFERIVLRSIASKRFTMTLLAIFAGLALVLASIGIYGVLSYLVGQRTREIGIRMALGAARSDVLRIVLRDGARMTLIGIGIGVAAALGLTRLMSSMLFGVRPTDVVTFLLVIVTLCSIALLACYIPGRRAMTIDPMIALRDE